MPSSVDNIPQLLKKTKEIDLPITAQTILPAGYIGAIILNVATNIFLAFISRYDILFPTSELNINDHSKPQMKVQTISNETRTIYTAAITLLATLLSAFSVGQIKQLWLKRNATLGSIGISTKLREYNATLAGLSSISERCDGLGTTAMVTGLTPSLIIHSSPAVGHIGWLLGSTEWPGSPDCFERSSGILRQSNWPWIPGNETFLSIVLDTASKHCAPDRALKTMSSRSLLNGDYVMVAGIAVHNTALRLPYVQFRTGLVAGEFGEFIGSSNLLYDNPGFHWVSQCLPVLTHNPVQCRHSVTYEVNDDRSNVTFHADSMDCPLTLPITLISTGIVKDQRVGRACSRSQELGKTTLLFGAVGNNSAPNLYDLMHGDVNSEYNSKELLDFSFEISGDTAANREAIQHRKKAIESFQSHYPNEYGVTCEVNVEPSIGYRLLTLTSEDASYARSGHPARLAVYGGESCEPALQNGGRIQDLQSFLRQDEALAAGAGATASLLSGAEANLTSLMESMIPGWGLKTRSFSMIRQTLSKTL